MNTIRTVIIDDEQNTCDVISTIMEKRCPQVNLVGMANSVASGVKLIEEEKPDLVLLDIHLGDGSGFDLLKKLPRHDFKLIFITAYEAYAIKAFKFSAVDYLLKPINSIELSDSINRVTSTFEKTPEASWQTLNKNYEEVQKSAKKLVLKTFDSIFSVALNEVLRCEADAYYTRIFLTNGQHIMVSQTLKHYDELLTDYGFFRVHQSHLVNLDHFVQFKKADGGMVVLRDGSEVPVSHRRKDQFLKAIDS